jgi:outer membrane lipoprotein-sorting protein
LFICGSPRPVVPTEELTAVQVLSLVKAQENWDDEDASITFVKVDKKKQVMRSMRRLRKNYSKSEDLLRKTLFVFLYPPRYYGVAYLKWYHKDVNNLYSIWIYLPRLRRTTRIIHQPGEGFLRSIFLGADFTYGDFLERDLERDDHRILRIETLNYKECFVIESISVDKADPYSKKTSWVWKDNWVLLKREFYDSAGVLIKSLNNHWVKIEGYWTLRQSLMKDHRKNQEIIVTKKNVKYNTRLADSLFLPAQLEYTASRYQ